MRYCLFLLTLLIVSSSAQAQVSVSNGDNPAYYCYIAALASVHDSRIARDGIGDCNAALAGALSAMVRAATLDNRGILYDAKKDYSNAWDDFNHSISLNANLGDAWLNRGVARIRLKQPEDALVDIQKGISLGPSLPQIGYYDLGVAEENLGKITEAYNDFKRSVAADPDFAPANNELKNFIVTGGVSSIPEPSGPPVGVP